MPNLQTNERFANRYLLKKLIGVGGYSQVWLAEDIKSANLEVAIKIFAPGQGLDDKGLELFSKEYALVFNLNHSGLLKPTYFDDFEGSPYLVMQYCHQGSVFGKIGEISETELAHFMLQSASALNYLHQQDPPIIHQDIKPDNFLIDNQGNYLLADFGISSKIRRTLTKSIGAHASTGTLAYMPPEKFAADKQIIKAGDIFSLGVTMYELLTGDLPFGDNGGLTLKAGADVPNLHGKFSKELNHLLISCMAKDPWERPPAEKLVEAASKFLQTGNWPFVGNATANPLPQSPEQPVGGRKTHVILETEPLSKPKSEPVTEIEPESVKNYKPWIILCLVIVVVLVIFFGRPKWSSNEEQLELIRLDSIALADSLAIVAAEQQRIIDSINDSRNIINSKTTVEGEYTYPNGEKYKGFMREGKREGIGTFFFLDGHKYSGEWIDDKMNGQGTYFWPDGQKYVGNFKDDKSDGQGTLSWANGQKYDGNFKDDKMNGQGTLSLPDGHKYVGNFKDGKKNGQGTFFWANGQKYSGEWIDDKMNGQGTFFWADGQKYVGNFKDEKKDGFGKWYNLSGVLVYEGMWSEDQPVK